MNDPTKDHLRQVLETYSEADLQQAYRSNRQVGGIVIAVAFIVGFACGYFVHARFQ